MSTKSIKTGWRVLTLTLLACFGSRADAHLSFVKLEQNGLKLDLDGAGHFTLEYPTLLDSQRKTTRKLLGVRVHGQAARLTYEGDTEVNVSVSTSGEARFAFGPMPPDVAQSTQRLIIPLSATEGATWRLDKGAERPFPATKPAKPHLYQGKGSNFVFSTRNGARLSVSAPADGFLELTDGREWNWNVVVLRATTPVGAQRAHRWALRKTLSASAPPAAVDEFGQSKDRSYPDKVRSLTELRADVKKEQSYYASFSPPPLDAFGGLPKSGAQLGLTKTGFFHVERKADRWFLVNPEGNVLFHLGVGCFAPTAFTYVAGRESIYEWLPPSTGEFASAYRKGEPHAFDFHAANQIRKYGGPLTSEAFLRRMVPRARQFGFNSAGPFSGPIWEQPKDVNFPYVAHLPLATWNGIRYIPGVRETFDPYDPGTRALVRQRFAERLPPLANDPKLIGYFIANEPLFEDIPKVVPRLDASSAAKRQLVDSLKARYRTVDAFNASWGLRAKDFAELYARPLTASTRAAAQDLQGFTEQFLEDYFKLVHDTFRQHDSKHLLLGARLQSGTINDETLNRVMGKYVDVVSFNYYTYHVDKDFLSRIHAWTRGKPMLLSEFYFSSVKDSGLTTGGKNVSSQRERGLGYRHYVEQAASLSFVIGVEWFTLVDQPVTGVWYSKYQGESGNTGLFSVADRPWRPLVEEMARTNHSIYDVLLGKRPPYVFSDPRFNRSPIRSESMSLPRCAGTITLDGSTQGWPALPATVISGQRLVHGHDAGGVQAAFKTCWDDQNLYLTVRVSDSTPMQNTREKDLWNGDSIELFVGDADVKRSGPKLPTDRQLIFAASSTAKAACHMDGSPLTAACRAVSVREGSTGYTLQAAVPWSTLGMRPRAGKKLRFDLGVNDSVDGAQRTRQLMWNGSSRNSTDRSGWGQATLAPGS